MQVTVVYKIDKSGSLYISELKNASNKEFEQDVSLIFEEAFNKISIEPAKLKDGTPVEFTMRMPVKIIF